MAAKLANVSVTALTAPTDGVAPALLLSVADARHKTTAQYLFNAPEGISRLMLEHRTRPGLHFKATFLSGTAAGEAGGLGGLVLRCKHDGLGQLTLVGPAGEQRAAAAANCFYLLQQHLLIACICISVQSNQ